METTSMNIRAGGETSRFAQSLLWVPDTMANFSSCSYAERKPISMTSCVRSTKASIETSFVVTTFLPMSMN